MRSDKTRAHQRGKWRHEEATEFAEQRRRDDKQKRRDFELDTKWLKLEQQNLASTRATSQSPSAGYRNNFKMKDLLQLFNPFRRYVYNYVHFNPPAFTKRNRKSESFRLIAQYNFVFLVW